MLDNNIDSKTCNQPVLLNAIDICKSYPIYKNNKNKENSKTLENSEMIEVLKNINLQVKTQEMLAIVGASGSGKSTLLQILAGLDTPDRQKGKVEFLSIELSAANLKHENVLRNQLMGFVYQTHHLIPELNALENVLLPYWIMQNKQAEIAAAYQFLENNLKNNFNNLNNNILLEMLIHKKNKISENSKTSEISKKEFMQERAKFLLTRLGLAKRFKHKPSELSGGERQRVAIARALINQPLCVFADEPTGNLDQAHAHAVFDLFKELIHSEQASLVLVTHDLNLAKRCQQIHQLEIK